MLRSYISLICRKSMKIIVLLYRNFHLNSSPQTLLKLYKALVLPHLTYFSSVPQSLPPLLNSWKKNSTLCLENQRSVQYFSLPSTLNIPSLSSHRKQSKLILTFNNLAHLPQNLIHPAPSICPVFLPLSSSQFNQSFLQNQCPPMRLNL